MSTGIPIDLSDFAADAVINFNTGSADTNGNKWWCTILEGWFDPAELRQKWADKVLDHGQLPLESFFKTRALVIAGVVECSSDAQWYASQQLMNQALGCAADITSLVNYGTITVHETPNSRFAMFKLASKPKYIIHPGNWEFSIPLTCPDPKKYVTGAGTPGSVGNPGSFL